MRKQLLTITLLATTSIAFAQTVKYGAKAGVNLANQHLSDARTLNNRNLMAFNLGGIVDIGFTHFSIQPGVFFTTKGERLAVQLADPQGNAAGSDSYKYILNYVEVPLNLLYKSTLADNTSFHVGGGPYFAYGLSTKAVVGGVDYPGTFSNDGSYNIAYKNPDYGLNIMTGIVVQKYLIDIQYGLGLANLSYGSSKLQNRVLSFSVGYMF